MSDGFDFKELDKLTDDLLNFANDVKTKETKKFVKKSAGKLKTKEKNIYKSMGIGLEDYKTPDGKKISNSFKRGKAYKYSGDWACRAYNSSPHAHLINNGFVHTPHTGGYGNNSFLKVKSNKEKFIPGYHFLEKAANDFQDKYEEELDNFMDETLSNKGL